MAKERGFTLIELILVIAILAILAGVAVGSYRGMIAKAYKITLQHDLQNFVKAQENYLVEHGSYLGGAGDYIMGGRTSSGSLSASVLTFSPSEGVKIEITSDTPSFKAKASHARVNVTYEYDFVTRQTTER